MDANTFQELAAALQSIIISLGLVLGGIWTLLTFRVLGQKQKAEAELRDLQARLIQRSILQIAVEACQIDDIDSCAAVSVQVTVSNIGNRDTYMLYGEEGCLSVSRVRTDGTLTDERQYLPLRSGGVAVGAGLLAGESMTESFLFTTLDRGPYFVDFCVEVRDRDESATDPKPSTVDSHSWSAATIVAVRRVSDTDTLLLRPSDTP